MSAIRTLAAFIADHPRGGAAPRHVETAKAAFLDTLGCAFLGAGAEVAQQARTAAAGWGEGSVPVIGTALSLPAPWAAFANGTAAHAFDLDDYTIVANDHSSAVLLPALLAEAARLPEVPGADLIEAYLIGLEVICRLGAAVNMGHYNAGWHTTATIGSFGATATVCRLARLSAAETAMALALTPSLGTGYTSQFGTSAKPFHAGWSAKTGVVAAALAQAGATGNPAVLDGKVSFASLMVPGGAARFDEALAGLGETWGLDRFGLGAKLYPSCGYTHRAIDAALGIHRAAGPITAEMVESVHVSLVEHFHAILPFGMPETPNEALFSTAWCTATALATGGCVIPDFLPEAIARRDIRALAACITVEARKARRPEINVDPDDPDVVHVRLRDGREFREAVGRWTGMPGREMSAVELRAKFDDVTAQAGLSAADAREIAEAVDALDQAPDAARLHAALGARPAAPEARAVTA